MVRFSENFELIRGATGAARAPNPGKSSIMAARRRCRRRLLFFKIKVRPRSCRSYHVWRPCFMVVTPRSSKGTNVIHA